MILWDPRVRGWTRQRRGAEGRGTAMSFQPGAFALCRHFCHGLSLVDGLDLAKPYLLRGQLVDGPFDGLHWFGLLRHAGQRLCTFDMRYQLAGAMRCRLVHRNVTP